MKEEEIQTFGLGIGISKSHPHPSFTDHITTPHYIKESFPIGLKPAAAILTGCNFHFSFFRSALNVQFSETSTAVICLSILHVQF